MHSYVCLFFLAAPVLYDNLLSTKDARNNWEMAMARDVLTHQLKVDGNVLAYLKLTSETLIFFFLLLNMTSCVNFVQSV